MAIKEGDTYKEVIIKFNVSRLTDEMLYEYIAEVVDILEYKVYKTNLVMRLEKQ